MGKNNGFGIIAKIILLLFGVVFFFYPLAVLFFRTIFLTLNFSLFLEIISANSHLIWNSFYQAGVSTFFSVLIGVPAAYLIVKRDFFGKKVIKAFSYIPFVFPSILVVISFVIIFGNNGWINSFLKSSFGLGHIQFIYGFQGIILAHAFYNFPIIMHFVSNAFENLDVSMKEAARTLGANKLQVFFKITLPQIMPSLLSGALLVFIYCFMSFAIVLSFGGVQFSTLEVEIYKQISRNLNFTVGSVLALVQFFILFVVAVIFHYFSSKKIITTKKYFEKVKKLNPFSIRGFIEVSFLILLFAFIFLPLLSLILFAFFDFSTMQFTFSSFEKIFLSDQSGLGLSAISSIGYSLFLAFFSAAVATLTALIAAFRKNQSFIIATFVSSTIAISIMTLGFGYYLGFGSGNLIIIGFGHAILAFPFAYRIIKNSLNRIDVECIEVAHTLGANNFQVFKFVQLPRIKKAIFVSIAFSFAISLAELGLVLLLYDGVFATMPVYVYRLLSTFDLHAAAAMGVILISISFLCFYAVEYFSDFEVVV